MKFKHSLHLEFVNNKGQTKLKRNFSTGAMRAVRPFYYGDTLFLQIVTLGAGISADDFFELEIDVSENCNVVIINQSATKVLSCIGEESAKSFINVRIQNFSKLEFLSGLIIPLPNSNFEQKININLSEHAHFGYLEIFSSGRVQRGEYFLFKRFSQALSIKKVDRLIYCESYSIGKNHKENLAVLKNYRYLATGVWTYGLSQHPKGFEKYENGMIIWGRNHNDITFLRAVSQDGYVLLKKICNLVDEFRRCRGEVSISWKNLSSAFL